MTAFSFSYFLEICLKFAPNLDETWLMTDLRLVKDHALAAAVETANKYVVQVYVVQVWEQHGFSAGGTVTLRYQKGL